MNYIKQLEENQKNLAIKVAAMHQEISDFIIFLQTSPKFQNPPEHIRQANRIERKDWIATTDVINRLQEIKNLV